MFIFVSCLELLLLNMKYNQINEMSKIYYITTKLTLQQQHTSFKKIPR